MKKILCHTGPGGFSIDSFLGEGLAQKQEIIYYINLGYLSGGTVVAAISTAGAFLYEVTSETTDLVTIGDLMLKWISLSSRLLVFGCQAVVGKWVQLDLTDHSSNDVKYLKYLWSIGIFYLLQARNH